MYRVGMSSKLIPWTDSYGLYHSMIRSSAVKAASVTYQSVRMLGFGSGTTVCKLLLPDRVASCQLVWIINSTAGK